MYCSNAIPLITEQTFASFCQQKRTLTHEYVNPLNCLALYILILFLREQSKKTPLIQCVLWCLWGKKRGLGGRIIFLICLIFQICLSPPNWVLIWSNQDSDEHHPQLTHLTHVTRLREHNSICIVFMELSKFLNSSLKRTLARLLNFPIIFGKTIGQQLTVKLIFDNRNETEKHGALGHIYFTTKLNLSVCYKW